MFAFVFSKIIEAMVTKHKLKMAFVPIPCIDVNMTTDTMLKFDTNADANVNIDVLCERTFTLYMCLFLVNNNVGNTCSEAFDS